MDGLFAGWNKDPRAFLHFPDGREMSRRDFMIMSAAFAARLVEWGVTPGDRVAMQTEKSPEALALYAAVLRAGAVFLPLNTAYTAAEIAYFVEDAKPAVFVCDSKTAMHVRPLANKHGFTAAELNADGSGDFPSAQSASDDNFQNAKRGEDDTASILYTSGTTGRPKGAMLSHKNLLSNALALADIWRFSENDVLLHMLPLFHVHGLYTATNTVVAGGGAMLFLPKFDAAAACLNMPKATAMMGVPTYYTRLLAHPEFTRDKTKGMRLFVSGSAPLLPETHAAFEERTGHRILERYGMSETGMNTSNPYEGERRPGAVGFPLPGASIRIADEKTGEELPQGETGGIEIKGANVFSGYWEKPQQTAEAFRKDGYFITGDLGFFDKDGYLNIVGRAKDMFISGGLNVYPKEIETAINDLPGVLESAVIGAPHPDFGESAVAAVVAKPGEKVSPDAVISGLAGALAKFKTPKKVFVIDELPRNTMGKVQKNILRDKYRKVFS